MARLDARVSHFWGGRNSPLAYKHFWLTAGWNPVVAGVSGDATAEVLAPTITGVQIASIAAVTATAPAAALVPTVTAEQAVSATVTAVPATALARHLTERKFTASDGASGAQYGASQAISDDGSVIVIGATGASSTGAVYVYSGANWGTETKLTASDAAAGDDFGWTVSISADGAVICVGADLEDGAGTDRGAAYVYSGVNWATETKLTASDAADDDSFGWRVAVSADGAVIVVGAQGEDGAGTNRGAVYVYSGASWSTETKLTASDGADGDAFGTGVAISATGSFVAVGSYRAVATAGAVYVYSGASWTTETKLIASDGAASDWFGYSVAISRDGALVVVGAPFEESGAPSGRGAVYLLSGASWATESKLVSSDPQASAAFGWSVACSPEADFVVVSEPESDGGRGAVYLFSGATYGTSQKLARGDAQSFDGLGYEQLAVSSNYVAAGTPYSTAQPNGVSYLWPLEPATITAQVSTTVSAEIARTMASLYGPRQFVPATPEASDGYGFGGAAMTPDSSVIVISAPLRNGAGTDRGAVFVYSGANWATETILTASDAANGDNFGVSVAISSDGATIAIGADRRDGAGTNRGAVYVYSGTNWATETILTASDAANNDRLGDAVAISADGSVVLGGASSAPTVTYVGRAYLFYGANWSTEKKLTASDAAELDFFGHTVALSDDGAVAVIGALGADGAGSDRGRAYVYSGAIWGTETKLNASDAANGQSLGNTVAVSPDGTVAFVGASGVTSGSNLYAYSGASWGTETIIADLSVGVNSIAIAPDGLSIAAGSIDDGTGNYYGFIRVYSGANFGILTETYGFPFKVNAYLGVLVALSTDYLLSLSNPAPGVYGAAYLFHRAPAVITAQRVLSVSGETAAAVAAVPTPTIAAQVQTSITAVAATADAVAEAPTVAASRIVAVAAVAAETDTAALAPAVQIARAVSAVPAEAAATAEAPTVTAAVVTSVAGVAATADAVAAAPTVSTVRIATIAGVAAAADAEALAPSIAAQVVVTVAAPPADATAEALAPTISTGSATNVTVTAVAATADAVAETPTVTAVRIVTVAALAATTDAAAPAPTVAAVRITTVAATPATTDAEVLAPTITATAGGVSATIAAVAAEAPAAAETPAITVQVQTSITATATAASAEAAPPTVTAVRIATIAATAAAVAADAPAPSITSQQVAAISAPAVVATAEVLSPTITVIRLVTVDAVAAEAVAEVLAPTISVGLVLAVPATAGAAVGAPIIRIGRAPFLGDARYAPLYLADARFAPLYSGSARRAVLFTGDARFAALHDGDARYGPTYDGAARF